MIVNRLVPISIAIFRFLMVCKAVLVVKLGEKRVSRTIFNINLLAPVVIALMTLLHLQNLRLYLKCVGKEEQFLFKFPSFFSNIPSGTSIKLPFLHPFRLAFNIIAFSFILVVPYFYYKIYTFRESQATQVPGKSAILSSERKLL